LDGTKKLFSLAGPWFDVLERGVVLVMDELDIRLHPLLTRFLIGCCTVMTPIQIMPNWYSPVTTPR